MTVTNEAPVRLAIVLKQGETAALPVPEGRIVLEHVSMGNGLAQSVVVLYPHGDAAPHELARCANGSLDTSQMLVLGLAALEAWR